MNEQIKVKIQKDRITRMLKLATERIITSLSQLSPPLDNEKDILKLESYKYTSGIILITYAVMRNARLSKKEQNRSPYREIGYNNQVGRNS